MNNLWTMVAQRIGFAIVTLFIVSLFIFLGVELLPGDAAEVILGKTATPETVAAFRRELGLNLPLHTRYIEWVSNILQGDLGISISNSMEVSHQVGIRLFNTIFLASFAAVISMPLALALGILSALYRNTMFDRTVNLTTLTTISFPDFFVAYILILFFAINLNIFPSVSMIHPNTEFLDRLYRTLLPAITLTLVTVAHTMRMTRAAIINLLASPYIEMARLKGLSPARIIIKHALPNAMAPIITVVVINLAYLVVGVVVVEVVFVYPGLGQLLVESVGKRDIPVVQAAALIFAVTYILLNLLADILSIVSNPLLLHPRR
ncbi:MAG: ABC transporter permease [Gammaproteobacteria bacterium]|jgi:peptide/nickel transport system permease protein|nr:ABC transporter permease [Gammaproteobacteria bacterium]|tara:strand:+ start:681 stop:1640 length:960 start_codon:yes stop_codon:yes gene_type:complete